jgi:hypothetical protein
VNDRKGAELKTVVQLVVNEEVGIVTKGLPAEECRKCGRAKYLPVVRGPFPALLGDPTIAMTKTREYFGSGGRAYREVLVSQAIFRALAAHKVHGASMIPVAPQAA